MDPSSRPSAPTLSHHTSGTCDRSVVDVGAFHSVPFPLLFKPKVGLKILMRLESLPSACPLGGSTGCEARGFQISDPG